MSQEDEKDIEPVIDKKNKEPEQFGTRKAFKNLPRDLSPDDLNNSGTQKMLLAELERLEIANLKLETKGISWKNIKICTINVIKIKLF